MPDNDAKRVPIASPANMIPVQVVKRVHAAPDAVTFSMTIPGTNQAPAPYLPGQFVTLALPTPRETLYRSYSLCGDGRADRPWEITIKRLENGAVSTFFYEHVKEGMLIYSSLPRGTFVLPRTLAPRDLVVFVAAGSGITPIYGMIRAINLLPPEERPEAYLFYAAKSPNTMIFYNELRDIDPDRRWLDQVFFFSSQNRRLYADQVVEAVGPAGRDAHWYMCGPEELKQELIDELHAIRVNDRNIHSEVFATLPPGPAYAVASASSTGGMIHVKQTGSELEYMPQETVLAALERHGFQPDFNCRIGVCGSCKLKMLAGDAQPRGEALSRNEKEAGYILSCIAVPMGDVTLENGGTPPSSMLRAVGGGSSGKSLMRVGLMLSLGVMLLGLWKMTSHKPDSWNVQAAAPSTQSSPNGSNAPAPTTPAGSGNATPSPTSGTYYNGGNPPTSTGGGSTQPTATTAPSSGGGAPAPTATTAPAATPVPPPPTATPKPVATSTPSK